jgi:hypothetical protein
MLMATFPMALDPQKFTHVSALARSKLDGHDDGQLTRVVPDPQPAAGNAVGCEEQGGFAPQISHCPGRVRPDRLDGQQGIGDSTIMVALFGQELQPPGRVRDRRGAVQSLQRLSLLRSQLDAPKLDVGPGDSCSAFGRVNQNPAGARSPAAGRTTDPCCSQIASYDVLCLILFPMVGELASGPEKATP